ncbi:DNA cytosine methyltransferase [Achromobacter sp. Marseille-Q0513]|uniref:DNA cytosine methyltransferase n=1 Tax=Achromobacter sp. Marseille-Q0513 TaxID=2829161 RepID=UPI001B8EA878|nr:DNA cytosine methyltransferase [Achromobacter sp. Marseille-Q0513]MBR8657363.1 DNA cytosine methyltransferase [Achromobacter sp. Marseille-Q0513]
MDKAKTALTGNESKTSTPLTFLDLFSGCGGFSLGLEAAGLVCKAAVDSNQSAIETFKANHTKSALGLVRDLTKFSPKDLDELLGGSVPINVIVGGPPCQGFSKARMVDGSNHGGRLVHDARRDLYQEFLRFVNYYQPSVFIMENVPGIKSAAGGEFFTRLQVESRELGYRVIPYEVEAWRFGVPQKRIRQLIIGTRRELPLFIPDRYIRPTHARDNDGEELQPLVSLGEAIGDLPAILAGDEQYERQYDSSLREKHIEKYGTRYIYDVLQADKTKALTAHSARSHSLRDMRDFARLHEGENSKHALARGVEMEFPYDRENFKDRYTRQHRDQLCSTIVAHLKKDGLMFIHPTQTRSLTPREAARVQSFPDTFTLPEARTNSFAQIGNAVPPLVGKAMGIAVLEYISAAHDGDNLAPRLDIELPDGRNAAVELLENFVESTYLRPLANLSKDDFLRAWWAVGFLHPNLHPDAASDNGKTLSLGPKRGVSFVIEPVYVRSGWPVELIPVAIEARRRFDDGMLSEDEYYCSAAVIAGAVATACLSNVQSPTGRKTR